MLKGSEMLKIKSIEDKKEGRAKSKEKHSRNCLRCEKKFTASSKYIRLCDVCKKQNQSIDSSQL